MGSDSLILDERFTAEVGVELGGDGVRRVEETDETGNPYVRSFTVVQESNCVTDLSARHADRVSGTRKPVPWCRAIVDSERKVIAMSVEPNQRRTGTFLGVPYDWRRKGFVVRLKQRWWNPAEPRLFTPKALGWGYDINLARVLRRKPRG